MFKFKELQELVMIPLTMQESIYLHKKRVRYKKKQNMQLRFDTEIIDIRKKENGYSVKLKVTMTTADFEEKRVSKYYWDKEEKQVITFKKRAIKKEKIK